MLVTLLEQRNKQRLDRARAVRPDGYGSTDAHDLTLRRPAGPSLLGSSMVDISACRCVLRRELLIEPLQVALAGKLKLPQRLHM